MNPSLFFQVLRARFGLFALALCVTVVATMAVSILLPKTWRATSSLVVDRRESQSLSDALNAYVSPLERAAQLQTQVDIIKSPKVAHKVVESLQLAKRPDIREDFEEATGGSGSIEDWLADRLTRNLEVETSQSSVIHVSYNAGNAADAATYANAFAQAYMDTTLQLRVDPTRQAATWFDEQLQTLRRDMESAQQRLTEYQREHGIVSTDEKFDEEYARLTDLSGQLARAQERNVELQARSQLVQQSMRRGAPLDDIPEVRDDADVRELKARLLEGETALRVLATRVGDNHPEYRRQQAENNYRRTALNAEMAKVAASTTGNLDEGHSRAAELAAAVAAQRARVMDLKASRDGLGVLVRNVQTAQSAYDTAMQRSVVNRVESRASQSNAALLNPAVAPRRAFRPNLLLNGLLAVVVGVMLGVALVMLREMTDRRVHSVQDLADIAHAPLLGEIIAWNATDRVRLPGPVAALRRLQ
jgi:succinoglycan biosynthesis transport protein ExoP